MPKNEHPLKKEIKQNRGLTIRWVANQLVVSEQHLNNCLNGTYKNSRFPKDLIKRVCQLIGISPEPYLNHGSKTSK